MRIKGSVKVVREEPCLVLNYRLRPNQWENGIVEDVTCHVTIDGHCVPQYRVRLVDRVTTNRSKYYPNGGKPLILTVGDSRIEKIKK